MFWGLIMEPQKTYSQTVDRSFHISMAALNLYSCTDEPVQVMCAFENRKYLLCTLQKDKILQVPLDVNFEVGDQISFITNGESHVHLTGYLNEDFNDLEDEDAEEEDVEEEEKDLELSQSNIVSGKRAKKMCNNTLQPPAKKSKIMQLLDSVNSQDDDDSDDSDVNLSDILNVDDDDDDEDESNTEEEDAEEEDDDDDDEGDEEEDDDDDEEDVEDEEEMEDEDVKPKINGIAKDAKKKKVCELSNKKQKEQQKNLKMEKNQQQQQKTEKKHKNEVPQKKNLEGGVIVEEIRVGNGKLAQKGKTVQVYYEGRFKNNNKMFDSSTKGAGFKFRLGKQEVIKGWDIGVAGMKVGGKRRIVCPPPMAYGTKGSPPAIPPNSTLVFEVELKNVH